MGSSPKAMVKAAANPVGATGRPEAFELEKDNQDRSQPESSPQEINGRNLLEQILDQEERRPPHRCHQGECQRGQEGGSVGWQAG